MTVLVAPFERWTPPPGGVSRLGCAMAWHWLDPATLDGLGGGTVLDLRTTLTLARCPPR